MNYTELIQRIHAGNKAKGFWPEEGRDMGEVFALIHAEASEALEAHRKGLPMDVTPTAWEVWRRVTEGQRTAQEEYPVWFKDRCVAEELADVVIRVLDLAGHLGDAVDISDIGHGEFNQGITFGKMICTIHLWLSLASENNEWHYLRAVISVVETICTHYGINLSAHIEAKLAYNATRPMKHAKHY